MLSDLQTAANNVISHLAPPDREASVSSALAKFIHSQGNSSLPSNIYLYKSHKNFWDYEVSPVFHMRSVAEYKLVAIKNTIAYFELLGADYPGFPQLVSLSLTVG